jgi:hypothetical protein
LASEILVITVIYTSSNTTSRTRQTRSLVHIALIPFRSSTNQLVYPFRSILHPQTLSTIMTLTYALPEVPVRATNRPRPGVIRNPGAFAASESLRKLTPYPDPAQRFPLSEEDEMLIENDTHSRPVEVDFTPLPPALRRSPTAPSRSSTDGSSRMRKSSLPSLVASSIDSMAAAVSKRRRGWLIPQNVVDGLRDLKR